MPKDLQYFTAKQLEFLAAAKFVSEHMKIVRDHTKRIIFDCQRSVRLKRAASIHQFSIDDYFDH